MKYFFLFICTIVPFRGEAGGGGGLVDCRYPLALTCQTINSLSEKITMHERVCRDPDDGTTVHDSYVLEVPMDNARYVHRIFLFWEEIQFLTPAENWDLVLQGDIDRIKTSLTDPKYESFDANIVLKVKNGSGELAIDEIQSGKKRLRLHLKNCKGEDLDFSR